MNSSSSASTEEISIDESWDLMMKQLKEFKKKHGDCLVPSRYATNRKLGHWVMTQRRQYVLLTEGKPSSLTKSRIEALEEIGFVWKLREDKNQAWNRRFKELLRYKAQHGDCLVPQRFASNPALGTWVNSQRRQFKLYAEGKKTSMTEERLRALDAIGFGWSAREKPMSDCKTNCRDVQLVRRSDNSVTETIQHSLPSAHFSSVNTEMTSFRNLPLLSRSLVFLPPRDRESLLRFPLHHNTTPRTRMLYPKVYVDATGRRFIM